MKWVGTLSKSNLNLKILWLFFFFLDRRKTLRARTRNENKFKTLMSMTYHLPQLPQCKGPVKLNNFLYAGLGSQNSRSNILVFGSYHQLVPAQNNVPICDFTYIHAGRETTCKFILIHFFYLLCTYLFPFKLCCWVQIMLYGDSK